MNIKHRINLFAALFALVTLAIVALFNPAVIHAMGFQMGVAGSIAHLAIVLTRNVTWLQAVGSVALIGRCDEPTLGELAVEFKNACAELQKKQKPLEDALPLVQKAIADNESLKSETKQKIDEGIMAVNEQKAVVKDLMQKMDALEQRSKAVQRPRSLKSALAESIEANKAKYDEFKAAGQGGKLRLDLKAITTTDGAVGLLTQPQFDGVLGMAKQPLRIRDLLTSVPVNSDSVRYAKQTLRTNAAKVVAQGTAKPYSAYKWENQTATIETLAHLAKMTLQAIADAPRLTAEVEMEMRYGLALIVEQELLNGDGTAGHLNGLMNQATAATRPTGIAKASVTNKLDVLRVAQLNLALQFAPADAQIISLVDWADIELMKDGQDRYLFGPATPSGAAAKQLWSLPVIDSATMAADNFLVGAFAYSVHLYDRQSVAVLISTENDTDFELNQATMRCEERLGLGVRRPEGLVKGTFTGFIALP